MADGVKVTLFRQWMHSEELRRISFEQKWDGWLVLPFCLRPTSTILTFRSLPPRFIISKPTTPILKFRSPPPPFYHFEAHLPVLSFCLRPFYRSLSAPPMCLHLHPGDKNAESFWNWHFCTLNHFTPRLKLTMVHLILWENYIENPNKLNFIETWHV